MMDNVKCDWIGQCQYFENAGIYACNTDRCTNYNCPLFAVMKDREDE